MTFFLRHDVYTCTSDVQQQELTVFVILFDLLTLNLCVWVCTRKVTLMEDSDQNIHLKNLSSHQASNEEEALNLLFLGDTNRMIAEVCSSTYFIHALTLPFLRGHIQVTHIHPPDWGGCLFLPKTYVCHLNGFLCADVPLRNYSLTNFYTVITHSSQFTVN